MNWTTGLPARLTARRFAKRVSLGDQRGRNNSVPRELAAKSEIDKHRPSWASYGSTPGAGNKHPERGQTCHAPCKSIYLAGGLRDLCRLVRDVHRRSSSGVGKDQNDRFEPPQAIPCHTRAHDITDRTSQPLLSATAGLKRGGFSKRSKQPFVLPLRQAIGIRRELLQGCSISNGYDVSFGNDQAVAL